MPLATSPTSVPVSLDRFHAGERADGTMEDKTASDKRIMVAVGKVARDGKGSSRHTALHRSAQPHDRRFQEFKHSRSRVTWHRRLLVHTVRH